jgi:hypothetical protein
VANRELFEELLREKIEKVSEAANFHTSQPRIKSAYYDWNHNQIVVNLENEVSFSFPPKLSPELAEASPEELADVEVTPSGEELHWESLDIDFNIASFILTKIIGTKAPIAAEMGRRGGSVSSKAKAEAARKNGKKGGRPRKAEGLIEIKKQKDYTSKKESEIQIRGLLKTTNLSSTDAEITDDYENYLTEEYL